MEEFRVEIFTFSVVQGSQVEQGQSDSLRGGDVTHQLSPAKIIIEMIVSVRTRTIEYVLMFLY